MSDPDSDRGGSAVGRAAWSRRPPLTRDGLNKSVDCSSTHRKLSRADGLFRVSLGYELSVGNGGWGSPQARIGVRQALEYSF